jgi:hypothetical protein
LGETTTHTHTHNPTKRSVRNITALIDFDDYVGAYKVWDSFLNGDSTQGGAWYTNVTGLTNYFNGAYARARTPTQSARDNRSLPH